MALENYDEMQNKTGDQRFLLMKQVENKLESSYPDKFRSRYAMVCYGGAGNVSYNVAQQLGIEQWKILEELCQGVTDASQVNYDKAEELINTRLCPLNDKFQVDLSTVSRNMSSGVKSKL